MIPAPLEEVKAVFAAAKNLNAALKNFIKKEVRAGDPIERFAKDFRAAVATGRSASVNAFIEKFYPANEGYFLVIAKYAHAQLIMSLVESIFHKYAEEFNATFERENEGIRITNTAQFSSIARSVADMIDEGLLAAGLAKGVFLKKAILFNVFEPEVLEEVLKVL